MEVVPGEYGAGVLEVEVYVMTVDLELALETRFRCESVARRYVMVEHDDLFRDLAERAQVIVPRRDVDEHHSMPFQGARIEVVLVAAGDVARLLAQTPPDGPGGAEAIGASSVKEAGGLH
jgi:hypothetical protein